MSTSHVYIAVEGPHDLELVAALLKPDGFERTRQRTAVDRYWYPLIPEKFPHKDDLLARVPVPTFFRSGDRWAAIHTAGGETNLTPRIEETLAVLSARPSAVGVLLDADSKKTPAKRFEDVAEALRRQGLSIPAAAGLVSNATPRCGVYVLPDNMAQGTLEDLLLECGQVAYPHLLEAARRFVDGVQLDWGELANDNMKDFARGAGQHKATIASMASVLRPGKAVQTSIQDNQWLKHAAALALPKIASLRRFLVDLLDLPST